MTDCAGVVSHTDSTVLVTAPYAVLKVRILSPGAKTRLRKTVLMPTVALGTKTIVSTGAWTRSAMAVRDSWRSWECL